MRKELKKVVKILTFFCVLVGAITIWRTSLNVLKTAGRLFVLNDNISVYNEQYRKTDEMTAEAEKYFKEREENFYNSDDAVVRLYSNSNALLKVVFFVVALALVVLMPIVFAWNIICFVCKKQIRQMKVQQKIKEQEMLKRKQQREEKVKAAEAEYQALLHIVEKAEKAV